MDIEDAEQVMQVELFCSPIGFVVGAACGFCNEKLAGKEMIYSNELDFEEDL